MAYWKLWTKDLARGRYTLLTGSSVAGSVPNTVDGDPSSLWYPGAGAPIWKLDISTATVAGFGIANHNLNGCTVQLQASDNGSTWLGATSVLTVATAQDMLYGFNTPVTGTYWKLVFGGMATTSYVGIVSLLLDYGYSSTNAYKTADGYGVITLGNQGTVTEVQRGALSSSASVETVGGRSITQYSSAPYEGIGFNIFGMRAGADLEWWRLQRSFTHPGTATSDVYANPGWAKGVWVTSDEHTMEALSPAWYCQPAGDLQHTINSPAGRVNATINLRTRSVGA